MYWMTSAHVQRWEECKSFTLQGAKQEASKRFGGGFIGDILRVGEGDLDGGVATIASKNNILGARWVNTPKDPAPHPMTKIIGIASEWDHMVATATKAEIVELHRMYRDSSENPRVPGHDRAHAKQMVKFYRHRIRMY